MLQAVQPRSSGFGGGALVEAGRPTAVGGGGFASPGTAAALPGVPTSSVIEARNNRGTNVQIPYARLVPLHARENKSHTPDKRHVSVDGKPQLEYDGLRSGELGWVLGRRFMAAPDDGAPLTGTTTAGAPDASTFDDPNLSGSSLFANQAHAGLGFGVDRMQRLASTSWIEGFVKQQLGSQKVNLHQIQLGSAYNKAMDAGINLMHAFVAGSTAIHGPDIVDSVAQATGAAAPKKRLQGILVAEKGPFLRGMQVDSSVFEANGVLGVLSGPEPRNNGTLHLARHEGDNLCFAAMEVELRRRNLLNWSPDGVVLSKLESPTDEPMKSTELDARGAQLFNVAVQGPATTTVWTSDYRDHKLECQPMDKVFICLVADVAYNYTDDATFQGKVAAAAAARNNVVVAANALHNKLKNRQALGSEKTDLKAAIDAAMTASNELASTADKIKVGGASKTTHEDLLKAVKDGTAGAQAKLDATFKDWDATAVTDFKTVQDNIRKGVTFVGRAVVTNFRLMRSTSSHLNNYSHWKSDSPNSRCGLRLGKPDGNGTEGNGSGEYIVGAWCIGTVLDSAASRSTVGSLTRTAPTSMALRVSVNVEWWSGDKLYKHYMDTNNPDDKKGGVLARGRELVLKSHKRPREAADADIDA